MGATIYIYIFSPFSLFVNVYVYASVCDVVSIALLLPFVLGFYLSGFLIFLDLCMYVFIYLFLATPCGMWDLCSLTRDRTCTSCIGSS